MLKTIANVQRLQLLQRKLSEVYKFSKCNLNLLEYQSKNLLRENLVAVQKFVLVDDIKNIDNAVQKFNASEYVVKAQVLAGGRGKGHFDDGFKGGVHVTKNRNEVKSITKRMIGRRLITKQTPKEGIPVGKVMIAESVNIARETYLCIIMDRAYGGPAIVASPAGGVDIETVAKDSPHLLKTFPVDIFEGVSSQMADEIAAFLDFRGEAKKRAAEQIERIWSLFLKVDCVQLEINPLVETDEGAVVAVDAKLAFDDNAKFRHVELFESDEQTETDPRELEAARWNLNYVSMDGNIGCLVNGAGLAMATMDIVQLYGGRPANFLDVGGGVGIKQVTAAFKILTEDKNVKTILVNVFGGIVDCATIANGIVGASRELDLKVPLVVRLEGTNVTEARRIIKQSNLPIIAASDLDDAAKKAVASLV